MDDSAVCGFLGAGKVACVAPDVVIPSTLSLTSSPKHLTRWTACTSLKYAVASVDTRRSLRGKVDVFINLIGDEDLPVRQAALAALNTMVHVEPVLVQHLVISVPEAMDLAEGKSSEPSPPSVRIAHILCRCCLLASMPCYGSHCAVFLAQSWCDQRPVEEVGVLPYLYFEMQPRESLKRVVNLGPFSHNVDDGVPLRKVVLQLALRTLVHCFAARCPCEHDLIAARWCARVYQAAFACIDSILEHLRERVGLSFLPRLAGGLRDENADIQMMCHQLVVKMCAWSVWQHHLLADLSQLVSSLEASLRPPAKVLSVIETATVGVTCDPSSAFRLILSCWVGCCLAG